MKQVSVSMVDLNLLKTFLAIWDARSLTVAAEMLHLSQPAVSHALRRLREVFDDPLFVRSGVGMSPTATAVCLHAPLEQAMALIHGALQRHVHFSPGTSDRVFRLSMSDMAVAHVMPLLAADLMLTAPGVRLETRSLNVDELDLAMRNGDVDIAVGYLPGLSEDCHGETLMIDRFVCLLAEDHPLADQDLTVDALNAMSFVHAATNVTGHGLAERALRAAGVQRKIAVTVPHFTLAPRIAATTRLGLIVPRAVARGMVSTERLRMKSMPCPMPPLYVKVYSHQRFRTDPGIVWLREKLLALFSEASHAELGAETEWLPAKPVPLVRTDLAGAH